MQVENLIPSVDKCLLLVDLMAWEVAALMQSPNILMPQYGVMDMSGLSVLKKVS